jgi:hypothetical protein
MIFGKNDPIKVVKELHTDIPNIVMFEGMISIVCGCALILKGKQL